MSRKRKLYCIIGSSGAFLAHQQYPNPKSFQLRDSSEIKWYNFWNPAAWKVATWEDAETMIHVLNDLTGDLFDFREYTGPWWGRRKLGPPCNPLDMEE